MKVLLIHTFNYQVTSNDDIVRNDIKVLGSSGAQVMLLRVDYQKTRLSKLRNLIFDFTVFRKICNEIQSFKPDVVHLHALHFTSLVAAIYAIKRFRLPLVYTIHNYFLLCPSGSLLYREKLYTKSLKSIFPLGSSNKKFYDRSLVLGFGLTLCMGFHQIIGTWKKIDRIIITGDVVKDIFSRSKLSFLTQRMTMVSGFSYPERPEKKTKVSAPYYLFVGDFNEASGLVDALEVFADNGLSLYVAGRGYLKKLIEGYALHYPNIVAVDLGAGKSFGGLLKYAAALIVPTIWYDPFGLTVMQAFSAGLPVIAAKNGVGGGYINPGHNGFLFESGNVNDLRANVDEFQAMTWSQLKACRENARQTYSQLFTYQDYAPQLASIYRDLLLSELVGSFLI